MILARLFIVIIYDNINNKSSRIKYIRSSCLIESPEIIRETAAGLAFFSSVDMYQLIGCVRSIVPFNVIHLGIVPIMDEFFLCIHILGNTDILATGFRQIRRNRIWHRNRVRAAYVLPCFQWLL